MEVLVRVVLGLLLVAHGLVHLLWWAPDADARWPFRLDRSWLLPEAVRGPVAVVLISLTVVGFALLGLAVWGVAGLAPAWPVVALGAALASLTTLVVFFDRRLLWGVGIDLVVVAVAWWRPGWSERLG